MSRSLRSAWIEILPKAMTNEEKKSRSLRSAWIEIMSIKIQDQLRASRSLRSAWIEIMQVILRVCSVIVALLAERVDFGEGLAVGAIPLPSSFFRCIFPVFLACGHCGIIGEPLPIR